MPSPALTEGRVIRMSRAATCSLEDRVERVDRADGHADRFQPRHRFVRGITSHFRFDQRDQCVAVLNPAGIGGKTVVLRPFLVAQKPREAAELAIVADGRNHVPVGCSQRPDKARFVG